MKTINGRMRPLANLAMGLALISIPVQAMAQEGHGGGERGNRGGGAGAPAAPRGDMGGQRGGPAPGQAMGGGFGGGPRNGPAPAWGGGAPAAQAAPAARPAPPAPPAPGANMGGGWNGGQRGPDRGPDRGAIGSGWNNGRGDAQQPRNDGFRRDERRDDRPNNGVRPGNESWRGTPGWPQGGVNRGPGWNGNRGPGMNDPRGDYRRWTQNWRQDNRYDWQRYRSSNRMAFHVGRYNPPYQGYSYRRLSVGLFLQPLFYSQSYVIYDPYNYRLPAVYGPYQWVRYYDDAMLVDTYTGEVVDVLYDFFW